MPPSYEPELSPVPLPRVARAMVAGLRLVRAHPVLNPAAFEESWRERGGYAVDPDHRPHLVAALDWLAGAQDASGEGGVARGYSLAWNPAFGSRAWQPADPGATGDIIPMLYGAARHLHRPGLAERAERVARGVRGDRGGDLRWRRASRRVVPARHAQRGRCMASRAFA